MKKYQHLVREQRYTIQQLLESGIPKSGIADLIGVHRSTVYREIERNSSLNNGYNSLGAQRCADSRRKDRFDYDRKIKGALEAAVREKLGVGWSPEQISERLKLEGKETVSHEAIYRFIYWDRQSGGNLYKWLRFKGKKRKAYGRGKRFIEKQEDRTSIDDRPEAIEKREEAGHWERDLIVSPGNTGANLLTLVERKTRYTIARKVESKSPDVIWDAMKSIVRENKFPWLSITNDNGFEFRDHTKIEKELEIPVYFCNPYSSWERGTVENTNGLIRQFFPKGTVFGRVADDAIQKVENTLNLRPRAILNYRTPAEAFSGKIYKLFRGKKYYSDLFEKWDMQIYEEVCL